MLRADFDYRVDQNNANGNGCIGNSAATNYCVKFNEHAVSNNKCLQTSSSNAISTRRHSDSQTIRTNVDSFQIVNKFALNNHSDSHYLNNGVDGGGASTTTTTTTAVYPSDYSNSGNCANFLVNKKSGSGAGRKFEFQSIDHCSDDSEISPLLERDATNSIALTKNNSASLIFTRKEFSPVVHRGKSATTAGAANNSSGGILTSDHVQQQRRSLQFNSGFNLSNNSNNNNNNNNCNSSAAAAVAIQDRRKHAKSWYASIYTTLDEVAELDLKVSH